ncbi:SapC family protein [Shewanella sp. AS16]|uniref:SapC family protein n=1 Tax=Shewanella sp. AS16 TaxID=2907625 RepID=UPI001F266A83|nr:SapC family protein [Shewanella sp. AS16]MCE9686497.1 SapC family protein [Shewanella sp. AS16]
MNKHVLLNNIDHKDLKIITARSAEYGDNQWFSVTFPAEFRSLQAHYPIFFHKDQTTGQFFAVALHGFQHKENLFLNADGWQSSYIPLTLRRQPFLIGLQTVHEDGLELKQRVIHIDMNSPRISSTQGEPLFHPYGGNTQYLDDIGDMLETIHYGLIDGQTFIDALIEHELLESFSLDITLDNGQQHQMIGFYTINEDILAELPPEALAQLHRKGYLQAIYMTLASQSRVRKLLDLKNARQ